MKNLSVELSNKERQGNGLDEMQTHQLHFWFYSTEVSGMILPVSAQATENVNMESVI